MKIKILGAESLGVRSLCCFVETADKKILIDPGIALGYRRFGLLPHPFQIAIGCKIRKNIISALKFCTDIVLSHYHGDHVPLPDANPFQLDAYQVMKYFQKPRLWCRGSENLSYNMTIRRQNLIKIFSRNFPNSEGESHGNLMFSKPVPHGTRKKNQKVMMTRIKEGDDVFVHASDIQLFDDGTISQILNWQPTIVLASGPPLYLKQYKSGKLFNQAWENAIRLAKRVPLLILDHHLLRGKEGLQFLADLSKITKRKIINAAEFEHKKPILLEAWRQELYKELPVEPCWHEEYTKNKEITNNFRKWRDYDLTNFR